MMAWALGSCPIAELILATSQSKMREYSVLASESLLSVEARASMGLTMGPAQRRRKDLPAKFWQNMSSCRGPAGACGAIAVGVNHGE